MREGYLWKNNVGCFLIGKHLWVNVRKTINFKILIEQYIVDMPMVCGLEYNSMKYAIISGNMHLSLK